MKRRRLRRKINVVLRIIFLIIFVISLVLLIRFGLSNILKIAIFNKKPAATSLISPLNSTDNLSDFKRKLSEKNISYSEIKENQDLSVQLTLKDGSIVLFSKEKDIEWQVSSLEELLSRLTIENKKPKTIDFRFDKPIVKFWNL